MDDKNVKLADGIGIKRIFISKGKDYLFLGFSPLDFLSPVESRIPFVPESLEKMLRLIRPELLN